MAAPATVRTSELPPVKRRQILAGARQVFAELGFERASVDQIAARAGVAKATIYHHFHDKKSLFIAGFSEEADLLREGLQASLGEPAGDVEQALQAIGEKLLANLLSPALQSLFRQTVAEAERFPELGELLWERGPKVVYEMLGAYLQRWSARGILAIDDPWQAAVHFVMLCQSDLLLRAQLGILSGDRGHPSRRAAARAVTVFLRSYGR